MLGILDLAKTGSVLVLWLENRDAGFFRGLWLELEQRREEEIERLVDC